jgi:hypothetical protein
MGGFQGEASRIRLQKAGAGGRSGVDAGKATSRRTLLLAKTQESDRHPYLYMALLRASSMRGGEAAGQGSDAEIFSHTRGGLRVVTKTHFGLGDRQDIWTLFKFLFHFCWVWFGCGVG